MASACRPAGQWRDPEGRARPLGNFGSAALVVACNGRLPAGSKMKLVWGKGIRAANGTPTGKAESFIYTVREPFKATLNCEREKAGAPCSPLSAISLNFNAPFDARLLGKLKIQSAGGSTRPNRPQRQWRQPRGDPAINQLRRPASAACRTLKLETAPPDSRTRLAAPEQRRQLPADHTAPASCRRWPSFPADFGILELKEGGMLPVTLRNVEPASRPATWRCPATHRFSDQRLTEDADVIAAMQTLANFEQQ